MEQINTSISSAAIHHSLRDNLHLYSRVYHCDNRAKECLDSLSLHCAGELSNYDLVRCRFITRQILDHAARLAETCPSEYVSQAWEAANYAEALMFAFESPLDADHIKECINEMTINTELN